MLTNELDYNQSQRLFHLGFILFQFTFKQTSHFVASLFTLSVTYLAYYKAVIAFKYF